MCINYNKSMMKVLIISVYVLCLCYIFIILYLYSFVRSCVVMNVFVKGLINNWYIVECILMNVFICYKLVGMCFNFK